MAPDRNAHRTVKPFDLTPYAYKKPVSSFSRPKSDIQSPSKIVGRPSISTPYVDEDEEDKTVSRYFRKPRAAPPADPAPPPSPSPPARKSRKNTVSTKAVVPTASKRRGVVVASEGLVDQALDAVSTIPPKKTRRKRSKRSSKTVVVTVSQEELIATPSSIPSQTGRVDDNAPPSEPALRRRSKRKAAEIDAQSTAVASGTSTTVTVTENPRKRRKVTQQSSPLPCRCPNLMFHSIRTMPCLIQQDVAADDWKLIVAVTMLNVTRGIAAIPVFRTLMELWPTPEEMADADREELETILRPLGLQRKRARQLILLSCQYMDDPPDQDNLRSRAQRISQTSHRKSQPYPPTAISHFPGVGQYALDSYRIFSHDLPGGGVWSDGDLFMDEIWKAYYRHITTREPIVWPPPEWPALPPEDPDAPEWKLVLPKDKELRQYLKWRWTIEGYEWDPEQGVVGPATLDYLWGLPHWETMSSKARVVPASN